MIILDTDLVSEIMRPRPDSHVVAWMNDQDRNQVRIAAITAAELRVSVACLPEGRRRERLDSQVEEMLTETFVRRILPFGVESTPHYAQIIAHRRSLGRPVAVADAQIGAIARAHHAILATRNTSDFDGCGIDLVNPWELGE